MPNHVLDLLQSPKGDLAKIIETVHAIQAISEWVQDKLPIAVKPHCQVGHYQKGVLTLVASSPAWATQLHFLSSELLQKLRQEPRWIGVCSIQIKVARLQAYKLKSETVEETLELKLPQEAAKALLSVAEGLDESKPGNEALKGALERLARLAIEKTT